MAIKIIRAIPKYRDASKIEVRVLQKLRERDPTNKKSVSFCCHLLTSKLNPLAFSNCIHLLTWFDHRNHICLVSELLGMCVYDFIKENDFAPFPRHHIQKFAKQLLGSVACRFLISHHCLLIFSHLQCFCSLARPTLDSYRSKARKHTTRPQ